MLKNIVIAGAKIAVDQFNTFKKAYNEAKKYHGLDGILDFVEKVPNAKGAVGLGVRTPGVNVNKFIKNNDPEGLLEAINKQKSRTEYTPNVGQPKSTVPKKKRIDPDTVPATVTKKTSSSDAAPAISLSRNVQNKLRKNLGEEEAKKLLAEVRQGRRMPKKSGGKIKKKYGYMGGGKVYGQPRKANYKAG